MPKKYTRTVTIDRSKHRAGDEGENSVGFGETLLLNEVGCMCCLGFDALNRGIPKKKIYGCTEPNETVQPFKQFYTVEETKWIADAIRINDDPYLTNKQREESLVRHFATNGIKLLFEGQYVENPDRIGWE